MTSKETKQDVFEDLATAYWAYAADVMEERGDMRADATARGRKNAYRARYAAALPDELAVIPEAVGEYIRKANAPGKWGLLDVFWHLGDNISAMGIRGLYDWQRWMVDNQEAIARAWLDGVWRLEQTGEVVKL